VCVWQVLRGVDAVSFSFQSHALDGDRFLAALHAKGRAHEERATLIARDAYRRAKASSAGSVKGSFAGSLGSGSFAAALRDSFMLWSGSPGASGASVAGTPGQVPGQMVGQVPGQMVGEMLRSEGFADSCAGRPTDAMLRPTDLSDLSGDTHG